MEIDLTAVIVAVVGVFGALLTGYIIPWLKSKTSAEKWEQLKQIASVVVNAAEQLGVTTIIEDKLETSREKLKYAIWQAEVALKERGLTFNRDTIRAAIEAEVLQLKTAVSP